MTLSDLTQKPHTNMNVAFARRINHIALEIHMLKTEKRIKLGQDLVTQFECLILKFRDLFVMFE